MIRIINIYLCHDHILALFNVFSLSFDDGVQKIQVLDMPSVGGQAMDEVLKDSFMYLCTKLVVIEEDMLHGLSLQ